MWAAAYLKASKTSQECPFRMSFLHSVLSLREAYRMVSSHHNSFARFRASLCLSYKLSSPASTHGKHNWQPTCRPAALMCIILDMFLLFC